MQQGCSAATSEQCSRQMPCLVPIMQRLLEAFLAGCQGSIVSLASRAAELVSGCGLPHAAQKRRRTYLGLAWSCATRSACARACNPATDV